jgi:hypothetical protein
MHSAGKPDIVCKPVEDRIQQHVKEVWNKHMKMTDENFGIL